MLATPVPRMVTERERVLATPDLVQLLNVSVMLATPDPRTVTERERDVSHSSSSYETEVPCVLLESCVLPCSFKTGTKDPVINWSKTPGDIPVHSYYHGQNQPEHQHENFTGRTSLFEKELSTGNASLLLSEVKVQDEGRYVCFTSSAEHDSRTSHIHLTVYAHIGEVNVVMQDSQLLCSAEGLYPEPTVTWFSGSSFTRTENSRTTVHQREDQLYNINSSVTQMSNLEQCQVCFAHICRSTIFILRGKRKELENRALLPCILPSSPIKSLIWKFNQENIICNQTGSEMVYNESWKPFVLGLTMGSFHLVLVDLNRDHEGLYSCHVQTDTVAVITITHLKIRALHVFAIVVLILHIIAVAIGLWSNWAIVLSIYTSLRLSFGDDDLRDGPQNQEKEPPSQQRSQKKASPWETQVGEVNVVMQDSELLCSSEGLYPEPTVTWFSGSSFIRTESIRTTVHQREDQLYNINSSVPFLSKSEQYECQVCSAHICRGTVFKLKGGC
ncbi:hypothetical protein WMY93_029943 [Mugilogobius chulae]|uniref:Ig-like domain-containing protein n=1 Tax=Mugilogobius chulae TaxID=88201 RepID=A0AAW0MUB2_9GOBI